MQPSNRQRSLLQCFSPAYSPLAVGLLTFGFHTVTLFGSASALAQVPVFAQSDSSEDWPDNRVGGGTYNRILPPEGLGEPRDWPGNRQGGGTHLRDPEVPSGATVTRGPDSDRFCGQSLGSEVNMIVPLVPEANSIVYTTQDKPLLLLYIPPLPSTASGKIALQVFDAQNGEFRGESLFNVPLTGGIVGLSLPQSVRPLTDQKFYKWEAQVACQTDFNLTDPKVSGWIVYQEGILSDSEPGDIPQRLSRVNRLKVSGYWLDAVLELVDLLNTVDNPALEEEWVEQVRQLLVAERLEVLLPYLLP